MMETYSLADRMMIESGLTPFPKAKKDGGPGSGNFGHEGVEGQVGGSKKRSGNTQPYAGEVRNGIERGAYSAKKAEWSRNAGRTLADDEVAEMVDTVAEYTRSYKDVVAASSGYSGPYKSRGELLDVEEKRDAEKRARTIERMIEYSDKFDGKTMRAMCMSREDYGDFMKSAEPGREIQMGHLSSWTTEEKAANRVFNSRNGDADPDIVNVLLECKSRSGVSIKNIADLDMDEVLYSKNSKFKVNSVDEGSSVGKHKVVRISLEDTTGTAKNEDSGNPYISENSLDNPGANATIEHEATNADGGPGSGRYPKGSGNSKFSDAAFTSTVVGAKTSDGRTVKSVTDHALKQAKARNIYPGSVATALAKGKRTSGNVAGRSVYDYKGTRAVVDDKDMAVITVIYKGK